MDRRSFLGVVAAIPFVGDLPVEEPMAEWEKVVMATVERLERHELLVMDEAYEKKVRMLRLLREKGCIQYNGGKG